MSLRHAICWLTLSASLCAGAARSAPIIYEARLSGGEEVPANASPGSGVAEVHFDTVAHTMLVSATFSGLIGNVTVAHIHCCAAPGLNAGVATTTPTFPGFPAGGTSGTYLQGFDTTLASTFNPSFVTANGGTPGSAETALANGMAAGLSYFNIHTNVFAGGEIRGQLLPRKVFGNGFEAGPG
jgi:hypothetical protein